MNDLATRLVNIAYETGCTLSPEMDRATIERIEQEIADLRAATKIVFKWGEVRIASKCPPYTDVVEWIRYNINTTTPPPCQCYRFKGDPHDPNCPNNRKHVQKWRIEEVIERLETLAPTLEGDEWEHPLLSREAVEQAITILKGGAK
jgi:hypothetical protein